MKPISNNGLDELKKFNSRFYVKAMISAWISGQEYAGISREQAGKNFMEYIQQYGQDKPNEIIEVYKLLKRLIHL